MLPFIYMKDLTEGKPIKVIWLYALPMILGQIAQQLYNFCDSAIVGNCINPEALAAVGATSVISNTLIGFLNSATLGLSIPIARYFGAQDKKNMRKCIGVSAILTLVSAIVLTIVGLLFIYDLLVLLDTPEEIIHMADNYVKYILAGLIFSAVYNFGANLLRAVGDSKTPLIFLSISVVLNIGLDLLFIQVFQSGVAGAAIATVISQAVAGIACFIYIFTYGIIDRFRYVFCRLVVNHTKQEEYNNNGNCQYVKLQQREIIEQIVIKLQIKSRTWHSCIY